MAKQITQKELAEIITKLLTTNEIDDADAFEEFMGDLAGVVTMYCGGEIQNRPSRPSFTPGGNEGEVGDFLVGIHANDSLPDDGGIWKDYDTDVAFINGEEVEGSRAAVNRQAPRG